MKLTEDRKYYVLSFIYINMKYFPKLIWDKIYLSPLNPDDAEILTKWCCDERIVKNTTMLPHIPSLEWERNWLINGHSPYAMAIVKKDWDEFIGTIELWNVDFINQKAELWISIWNVDEHGKWYWTDAIKTILTFAFNTLNLYNVWLGVKSFNKKAIAYYKKVWFNEIWIRHHCRYYDGEWYDDILMEILKPDFKIKNLSYD